MNRDVPGQPLTIRMVEAQRLHDDGLTNAEVAVRMGISDRRVSQLLRSAAVRNGQAITRRAPPPPFDTALRQRVQRLEDANQSLRTRLSNLEREVAMLRRAILTPITHRRVADGGVGGRKERRAV